MIVRAEFSDAPHRLADELKKQVRGTSDAAPPSDIIIDLTCQIACVLLNI